jgi:hypothetical protein
MPPLASLAVSGLTFHHQPMPVTPPMFFAHAADDRVKPENSIALFLAL